MARVVGDIEPIGGAPLEEGERRSGGDRPERAGATVAKSRLDDDEDEELAYWGARLEAVEDDVAGDDTGVEDEREPGEHPSGDAAAVCEKERARARRERDAERPGPTLVSRRVVPALDHDLEEREGRRCEADPRDPVPGTAQRYERAACRSAAWRICSLAAATTFSTVNPNFWSSSFSGAEAPKLRIPTAWPVAPTY